MEESWRSDLLEQKFFDAKKIAVISSGHEDMGGVGDSEVKSQLDINHENEKQTFLLSAGSLTRTRPVTRSASMQGGPKLHIRGRSGRE